MTSASVEAMSVNTFIQMGGIQAEKDGAQSGLVSTMLATVAAYVALTF